MSFKIVGFCCLDDAANGVSSELENTPKSFSACSVLDRINPELY